MRLRLSGSPSNVRGHRSGGARWPGALLLASAIAAACSLRPAPVPSVLLITLDTTRADYLGCYGGKKIETPSIDAFAKESVLFEKAFTATPLTAPAHTSILSGRYPTVHGVRDNGYFAVPKELPYLPAEAAKAGIDTAAFPASTPVTSEFGFSRGFALFDDSFKDKKRLPGPAAKQFFFAERNAGEQRALFEKWIGDRKSTKPFFAWLHFFDAHFPYAPPREFLDRHPKDPYGGEIEHVDRELGKLFETLKKSGLWDRMTIIVVADHGEGLGTHEEFTHGNFLYDETVRVPLLVKPAKGSPLEKHRGSRVPALVRSLDIYATVRRELGLPPDTGAASRDLVEAANAAEATPRIAYFETLSPFYTFGWSPMFGARDQRGKYVLAPKEQLFDAVKDPGETKSLLVLENADLARPLVHEVGARLHDKPAVKVATFRPSEAIVQQLQSLGYLAGGKPREESDWLTAIKKYPDPKDLADLLPKFAYALGFVAAGKTDAAVSIYDEISKRDPANSKASQYKAIALMDAGRWKDAETILRAALAEHADDVRTIAKLATVLRQENRPEESAKLLEAALATGETGNDDRILLGDTYLALNRLDDAARMAAEAEKADPTSAPAANLSGIVKLKKNDFKGAEALFREALRRSPDFYYAHKNLTLVYLDSNRPAESRKELEACVRLFPSDPEILMTLAQLDLGEGKIEAGIAGFEKAFALDPRESGKFLSGQIDERAIRLRLAEHFVKTGRIAEAKGVLDRGAERKELNAQGYYLAGDLHLQSGEIEPGLALCDAGLKLSPENPSLLYNLARGEAMAGRAGKARAFLVRAIKGGGEAIRKAADADPILGPIGRGETANSPKSRSAE